MKNNGVRYSCLCLICFIISLPSLGQKATSATNEKKIEKLSDDELIDFDSVKEVIKKDMLDKEVQKKQEVKAQIEQAKEEKIKRQYDVPSKEEFWQIYSEYWLVKNAPILKWDFEKPDYGIELNFKQVLEKLGYYEKNFRVLIVNTPSIYHMALPSDPENAIYLLALPFIRGLDLSKLEISLLLLENFLRLKAGYFIQKASFKELNEFIGSNFYQKKLDKGILNKLGQEYDRIVFTEGFSFQQQFEITKQMSDILKAHPQLWTTYYKMLNKIDDLVKGNVLYRNYNKIYPSPELQLNWLKPKGKIL